MGSPRPDETERVLLEAQPEAVRTARARLRAALERAAVPSARHHEPLLLVSELVTNAIQHGSSQGDQIEVSWTISNGTLRLAVVDAARGSDAPVALTPSEDRVHGRGLHVVDQLADRWEERIVGGRRQVSFRREL